MGDISAVSLSVRLFETLLEARRISAATPALQSKGRQRFFGTSGYSDIKRACFQVLCEGTNFETGDSPKLAAISLEICRICRSSKQRRVMRIPVVVLYIVILE